jgi:drug/metabolite transporter (DMT)-like permease
MEIARPKKRIALVIILVGILIILIGSVSPIVWDIFDEPHSFLNNLTMFFVLIALLLSIAVLVFYSVSTKSRQVERRISILLLIISILFLLIGTVSIVAVTAAIINKEPFGPGLYVMYVGVLLFFAGSIIYLRETKRFANEIESMEAQTE